MINLTKTAQTVHNWVDIIPYIMGGRQLVLGAALVAGLGTAAEQVEAQDNTVLAAAKTPAVQAILEDFRTCVDGAVAVTSPSTAPSLDEATRELVFQTMLEQCERSQNAKLGSLAARQEAAALTQSIIEGARREVGLES